MSGGIAKPPLIWIGCYSVLETNTPTILAKDVKEGTNVATDESKQATLVFYAEELSRFGFFERPVIREHLKFATRLIATRISQGRFVIPVDAEIAPEGRICVFCSPTTTHDTTRVTVVVCLSNQYPDRILFELLTQCHAKSQPTEEVITTLLTDYQCPEKSDSLHRIQQSLTDIHSTMIESIEKILQRGERIDLLVEKSTDLSASSRMFYKKAKSANSCCRVY